MDHSPEPPAAPGHVLPACFLPPQAHSTARHWGVGAGQRGPPCPPCTPITASFPQPSPLHRAMGGAAKGYPRNSAHPGTSLPPPQTQRSSKWLVGTQLSPPLPWGLVRGPWKSVPESPENSLRLQPPGKVTMGTGMGDPHGRGSWVVLGQHSLLPGELRCSLPQLGHVAPKPAQCSPLPPSVPAWVPQLQLSWEEMVTSGGGCPTFGVVSGIGRDGTQLNFPMQLMCFICSVTGGPGANCKAPPNTSSRQCIRAYFPDK